MCLGDREISESLPEARPSSPTKSALVRKSRRKGPSQNEAEFNGATGSVPRLCSSGSDMKFLCVLFLGDDLREENLSASPDARFVSLAMVETSWQIPLES